MYKIFVCFNHYLVNYMNFQWKLSLYQHICLIYVPGANFNFLHALHMLYCSKFCPYYTMLNLISYVQAIFLRKITLQFCGTLT